LILDFKCRQTRRIFNGVASKKLPINIQQVARRKLKMLNNAAVLNDLRVPPANQLERLKGDRKGQHSIRINNKYRICFIWNKGQILNVEIVDYH